MYESPKIEIIVLLRDEVFTFGSNSTPDDEL